MATIIYKVVENIRRGAGITFISSLRNGECDLSNYYSKTDLQTIGQSSVNFGNVSNAYHNYGLGLQGGLIVGDSDDPDDSSGTPMDDEMFHLSEDDWLNLLGLDFQMSVDKDSLNVVTLLNDEDDPGAYKIYSTDGSSVKGWHDLPAGTIDGIGTDNQIAVWTDEDTIEGTAGLTYDGVTLDVTGGITATEGMIATSFCMSSDERLKQNIKDIVPEPIDITYKEFELKSQPGQVRYGVIAQELITSHPELIRTNKDGMMAVAYTDLLILEIVDLKKEVFNLRKEINTLKFLFEHK